MKTASRWLLISACQISCRAIAAAQRRRISVGVALASISAVSALAQDQTVSGNLSVTGTTTTSTLVASGGAISGGSSALTINSGVTVLPSGYLGVGTSTPSTRFQVVGSTGQVWADIDSSAAVLQLRGNNGKDSYLYWVESHQGDRGVLGFATGSGDLVYRAGANSMSTGTEAFRVTSNGNVGIGTASPGAKLDVAGAANVSGNLSVSGAARVTGNVATTSSGSLTLKMGLIATIPSNATDTFIGVNDTGGPGLGAGDLVYISRTTATGNAAHRFFTETGGNPVERLTINSAGLSTNGNLVVNGATAFGGVVTNNSGDLTFTAADNIVRFKEGTAQKGYLRYIGGTINRLDLLNNGLGLQIDNSGNATFGGSLAVTGTGISSIAGDLAINNPVTRAALTFSGAQAGAKSYVISNQRLGVSNTGFSIRNTTDGITEFSSDGAGNIDIPGVITIRGTGTNIFAGPIRGAGQTALPDFGGTGFAIDQTGLFETRLASVKTGGSSSFGFYTYNGGALQNSWAISSAGNGSLVGSLAVNGTGTSYFAGEVDGPQFRAAGYNGNGNAGVFRFGVGGNQYIYFDGTNVYHRVGNIDQLTLSSTSAAIAGNLTVGGSFSAAAYVASGGTVTGGTTGLTLSSGGTDQNIALAPSGAGKVRVDSAGVAGSDARTLRLGIAQSAAGSASAIEFGTTTNDALGLIRGGVESGQNGFLAFNTRAGGASNEALRITSAGNVGIGTSNPGNNRLQIVRTLGTNDYTYVGQHSLQLRILNGLGANQNRAIEMGLIDNGTGIIQANEAGVGYNSLTLNPVAGNVGIGTISPQAKLDVAGDTKIQGNLSVTGTITASSGLALNASGTNQNVTISPTGTGKTILNGDEVTNGSVLALGGFISSNYSAVGLEKNILFNATNRYQVTQTGPAPLNLGALFDGYHGPSYSNSAPTAANPQVVLIEGLPQAHTQAGAWVGWSTRYWAPSKFKIEGYDVYAYNTGAPTWRTIADYSTTPYSGSEFQVRIPYGGEYTKLRYTFYEGTGDAGKFGISELFLIEPEATRPYAGLLPSSMYEGLAGKVGIGTASPQSQLEVEGAYPQLILGNPTPGPGVQVRLSDGGIVRQTIGHLSTTHSLQFGTGGTDATGSNIAARMTIDENGNVGVGTTTPSSSLHVVGSGANFDFANVGRTALSTPAGNPGFTVWTGAAYNQNRFDIANYGGYFGLGYNADTGGLGTSLTIKQGGNVGVGTTSPSYKFVATTGGNGAQAQFGANAFINTYSNGAYFSNATFDSAGAWTARAAGASTVDLDTDGIRFFTNSGLTAGSGFGPAQRMVIDSAGNIGVGVAVPNYIIDVNAGTGGTLANYSSSNASGAVIRLNGGNQGYIGWGPSVITGLTLNDTGISAGGTGGSLVFGTAAGVERMRITASGSVGIGAVSPSAKLEVNGTAQIDGQFTAVSGATINGQLAANAAATFNGNVGIGTGGGVPAEKLKIDAAANGVPAAGLIRIGGGVDYSGQPNNVMLSIAPGVVNVDAPGVSGGRFKIDANGNVGIGQPNPNQKLVVEGNIALSQPNAIVSGSAGGTKYPVLQADNNSDIVVGGGGAAPWQNIRFYTAATEHLTLTPSGNVGVGTTAPGAKLDVTGDGRFTTSLAVNTDGAPTGGLTVGSTTSSNGGNLRLLSSNSRWGLENDNGTLKFFREDQTGANQQVTESMSADATVSFQGRVTTQGLTVASGDLNLSNLPLHNLAAPTGTGDATNKGYVDTSIYNAVPFTWNAAGHLIALKNSADNLGLGTTSPTYKLDVFSGTGARLDNLTQGQGLTLRRDASGGNQAWTVGVGTSSATNSFKIADVTANTDRLVISSLGRVGLGSTAPQSQLDINSPNNSSGDGAQMIIRAPQNNADEYILFRNYWHVNDRTAGFAAIGFNDKGSGDGKLWFATAAPSGNQSNVPQKRMFIDGSGNVSIGSETPQDGYRLSVEGKIRAREVVVNSDPWADYVFTPGYRNAPLSEVEQKIKEEGHLPGVPSAQEVAEHGVNVGQMQTVLLQKIEELTLHMIEQEKRIQRLEQENASLRVAAQK